MQIFFFHHRNLEKGNIVTWEEVEFDLKNMNTLKVPVEEICFPARPGHVLMPNRRNFSSHVATCKKFHGKTSVITDIATQTSLMSMASEKYNICKSKY